MPRRYEIREEVPSYVLLERVAAYEVAERLKISNYLHEYGPELMFLYDSIKMLCNPDEVKLFEKLVLRPATRKALLLEIYKDSEFRHKLYMIAGVKHEGKES